MTNEMPTFETPIDEIYWIRQKISAEYDHDPHKYYVAASSLASSSVDHCDLYAIRFTRSTNLLTSQ